jgi:hypothetical protein
MKGQRTNYAAGDAEDLPTDNENDNDDDYNPRKDNQSDGLGTSITVSFRQLLECKNLCATSEL